MLPRQSTMKDLMYADLSEINLTDTNTLSNMTSFCTSIESEQGIHDSSTINIGGSSSSSTVGNTIGSIHNSSSTINNSGGTTSNDNISFPTLSDPKFLSFTSFCECVERKTKEVSYGNSHTYTPYSDSTIHGDDGSYSGNTHIDDGSYSGNTHIDSTLHGNTHIDSTTYGNTYIDSTYNMTQHSSERFNPYEDNSGTSLALKQDDFIIVAADTRQCSDMGVYSRTTSKIFRINDILITVTGFYADGCELYNKLMYQVQMYESINTMNIHSLANLTSKILYSKRFFPYYAYVSLSGFHNDKPYTYGFDCVGSYESVNCICNGSGSPLIQPLLDSFIDKKNWHGESPVVDEDYALHVVCKAFDAAAERDVKTGDYLEVYVVNRMGIRRDVLELRKD